MATRNGLATATFNRPFPPFFNTNGRGRPTHHSNITTHTNLAPLHYSATRYWPQYNFVEPFRAPQQWILVPRLKNNRAVCQPDLLGRHDSVLLLLLLPRRNRQPVPTAIVSGLQLGPEIRSHPFQGNWGLLFILEKSSRKTV